MDNSAVRQGWYDLAAAVIQTAISDYRIAVLTDDEKRIYAIERFFRSTYFHSISDIDPNWLVPNLREKYEEEKKTRMRTKKKEVGNDT